MGTKRILLMNIYLANVLLGTTIPDYIIPQLKSDKKIKTISNNIKQYIFTTNSNSMRLFERVQINLVMRDKVFFGLMDSLKGALKPTVYEWKRFSIPLFMYPIYFLLRPLFLLIRYKI